MISQLLALLGAIIIVSGSYILSECLRLTLLQSLLKGPPAFSMALGCGLLVVTINLGFLLLGYRTVSEQGLDMPSILLVIFFLMLQWLFPIYPAWIFLREHFLLGDDDRRDKR